MAYKQKGNINFGEGTGSAPNKIKAKVVAKGAGKFLGPAGWLLEVPDIAHKMFTFSGGKGYGEFSSEEGQEPKYIDPATNKPVDLSKKNYNKNMITGEVTITDKKKDDKDEIPDWAYEAANVENPNKPKEDPPKKDPPKKDPPKKDPPKVDPPKVDPPKEDPPKVDPPKEEIVEDKKKKKKKSKFRYNF